ncbi:hypothetical protein T35B1_18573 [Salinisphaera shabanensis T35B1]|uniref:hypothetical protein n=1 Tax=Salinisphaera shabanensis TaxID=180542 RepID=UPI003341D9AC
MIDWQYFPKSDEAPEIAHSVVAAFVEASGRIDSFAFELPSNEALAEVCGQLLEAGFEVETGKKKSQKILVPVLFGLNGRPEKSFEADAYHRQEQFVLEVEAGRAVVNNQFLKDLFQACMMHGVKYLGIAVRKKYRNSNDFERVIRFIDTLYASSRIRLPLQGILIIGY